MQAEGNMDHARLVEAVEAANTDNATSTADLIKYLLPRVLSLTSALLGESSGKEKIFEWCVTLVGCISMCVFGWVKGNCYCMFAVVSGGGGRSFFFLLPFLYLLVFVLFSLFSSS